MWNIDQIKSQAGKTVVITGGNTGIGYETAKALYLAGAKVILACRDMAKAELAAWELTKLNPLGQLETAFLDLSSLQSVNEFSKNFLGRFRRLDVLINNAGIMMPPAGVTSEGYELQFGVNHLGHFALTGQLFPLLKDTPDSRVVTLTSLAYIHGSLDFQSFSSIGEYNTTAAYAQSKLANIVFSLELQRRINLTGVPVSSLAAHPGIATTEITRHMNDEQFKYAQARYGEFMPAVQAALSVIYAAVSPRISPGGLYGPDSDAGLRGYPAETAILEHALDESQGRNLWAYSQQATGVEYL